MSIKINIDNLSLNERSNIVKIYNLIKTNPRFRNNQVSPTIIHIILMIIQMMLIYLFIGV